MARRDRYTPAERAVVVDMFLTGIDAVSFDVLREELRLLLADRARIDRMEQRIRASNERFDIPVHFGRGETLREVIDRLT